MKRLLDIKVPHSLLCILLTVWFALIALLYIALMIYCIYDFIHHRDGSRIIVPASVAYLLSKRKEIKYIKHKVFVK